MKRNRPALLTTASAQLSANYLIGLWTLLVALLAPAASAANPEPEWIDWGKLIAGNDTDLFYAQTPEWDTNPCGVRPDLVVFGSVPRGGGEPDKDQVETGCGAVQPNAMVAGDTYLFYVLDPPTDSPQVYRMPLTGGASEWVSFASYNAIGKDDDWVYFFNDFTIQRVLQSDPTQQEFLATHVPVGPVNRIVTDDTYMYWTEGNGDIEGAVRAMAKTGGTIFTAASGPAVEGARDIAVTEDYVYWTELGGRLRRVLKSGGSIDTLFDGDEPVYSLAIDGDLLVFGRGGTGNDIWRMPVDGGTPTLMAFDQAYPYDMVLTDGYVYWANSRVQRLPDTAEADGVDYMIDRMEVTQAIQDGFHSVGMAADKLTYVRVYPRETIAATTANVRAQLHGTRDGVALPGSPLQPISGLLDPDIAGATRGDAQGTYVFALPPRWVDESVSLRAEINPVYNGTRRFELNYANNFFPVFGEQFVTLDHRGVCLATSPVAALDAGGSEVVYQLNTPDYFEQLERAEMLTPGILIVVPMNNVLYKGDGTAFNITVDDDRGELMSTLAAQLAFSDSPFVCGENLAIMTGLVSNEADTFDPDKNGSGFSFAGQGNSGLQSNWTKMLTGTDHEPFNQPRGAVTLAHEIGHVLGRPHTDCGGPAGPGPFPYPPCQLDDGAGEDNHWGFDGLTRTAIHPTDGLAADLLSYNYNRWPSDFTWTAMLDAMDAAGVAERTAARAVPELRTRGLLALNLRLEQGQVRAQPGFILDEDELTGRQNDILVTSLSLDTDADYLIEQLGVGDQILYTQPLAEDPIDDNPGDPAYVFETIMPFDTATVAYRLYDRERGVELWRRTVSAGKPLGFVLKPRAGEVVDGTLTVAWLAFDGDGDDVTANVQYSADGGTTWQAIALNASGPLLRVPTDNLPGTEPGTTSLVRVVLSDGTRSRTIYSKGFEVTRKVPLVHILGPESGSSFPADESILARAAVVDAEGELPGGGRLSWYLDGVYVDHGDWIVIESIPPGWHTLELFADDSDGRSLPATVRFEVERDLPPPM
ncbi:DUF5050 domain-containing protein [Mangrovimicrobium sediminis]|nr:DUF5050 domain-containing protein [Haliea sp. SAOS-164]